MESGKARVYTRNGFDWSDRYPSIVRASTKLRCKSAIIDGEAIVQNGNGASDFESLRSKDTCITQAAVKALRLSPKDTRTLRHA
jgi:ATP-dependent DNA ligase